MSRLSVKPGPVVCFGEVLLRLSTPRGELLAQARRLGVDVGGAEANVAVALAHLGHAAAMVTTLPDQALGRHARDVLRSHGVDTAAIGFATGRMGLYFLEPGAVQRPSDIIYDRNGSAFALRAPASYDWDTLLAGAGWLHMSGITAAVSAGATEAVFSALASAHRLGGPVSFDGNYRASLWAARGEDGVAVLSAILAGADLAFIDQRDVALLLGEPELAADVADTGAAPREAAMRAAFGAWPRLKAIACTTRAQLDVDHHRLSAHWYHRDDADATRHGALDCPATELRGIVDRIGTGDAFAAGILHGVLRGWPEWQCLAFALAAACSKHSVAGDMHPLSEARIIATMEGTFDVRR
jgi:2-dehydro-3-deoxygluconokinase